MDATFSSLMHPFAFSLHRIASRTHAPSTHAAWPPHQVARPGHRACRRRPPLTSPSPAPSRCCSRNICGRRRCTASIPVGFWPMAARAGSVCSFLFLVLFQTHVTNWYEYTLQSAYTQGTYSAYTLSAISIKGIIDHLYKNNLFLELELGCVSNSTICFTNFIVELLHNRVSGTKLQKRERSIPK